MTAILGWPPAADRHTPRVSDVVVVTWEQVDRPRSGGAIRSLRLLQALAPRCDLHVVLIGPDVDEDLLRDVSGAASVASFPLPPRPLQTRWWAVQRSWPLEVSRRWS